MNTTEEFIKTILASDAWETASKWGQPRPGHPEGSVGLHVEEQVLPFIKTWYKDLPEYLDLVALAYLHDIGKPITKYEDGHLAGPSHSVLSAQIAKELGASERLVRVILLNDRAYSQWRKLINKDHIWSAQRWTADRRTKFVAEFGAEHIDLRLLVLFHRADNGYRRAERLDESVDSVLWFENRLIELGLLMELPLEGKDQRLDWIP